MQVLLPTSEEDVAVSNASKSTSQFSHALSHEFQSSADFTCKRCLIKIPKRKLGSHCKKCRCAIIGATSSHTPPRATEPSCQRLGFVTYLMSTSVVDLECFRAGDERFCNDVLCCRLVDSEEEVVDVCLLIILTADNPNSALLVSYRLYDTERKDNSYHHHTCFREGAQVIFGLFILV